MPDLRVAVPSAPAVSNIRQAILRVPDGKLSVALPGKSAVVLELF